MKTFIIVHNLVADSGHFVSTVMANNENLALKKYQQVYPNRCNIGVQIYEITQEVQTIFRYDNPNYEG
jgi:hypothetical protein